MASRRVDVLILGGGNAGLGVTVPTREAGMSVALVESRDLGGTCSNRGCTPKKVLVAAAHALHEIELAKAHHITVGRPTLDWAALIDREKAMIADVPKTIAGLMEKRGVDVVRGAARFIAPDAVAVDGETIEARHIVIATGSKPRALPIPGAEHMITSDDVLSERTLPRDVVFIGGGVIALEFSHVYVRAGARVTILEALPRLLGAMDADAVDRLHAATEALGIGVRTDVKVQRIEKAGDRLRVVFDQNGEARAVEADRVVNGVGRVANVDRLDLDAGKVAHEGGRVQIDGHLRSTSNEAVYVCGDALWSTPQLSPVATYEGRIVGRNIVDGPRHVPDYDSIPSCVFTVPALASVGLTEARARELGRDIDVHTADMRDWFSGRTYAEPLAWAKVVVDKPSDRILGAHITGHSGEELIHLLAMAIRHGITAGQIKSAVFGFPTFSADIGNVL
ncbi:MAG TPA: NAD(P)/FAD-dependent oxidoreductase [Alphaproteobacteria bacterium]